MSWISAKKMLPRLTAAEREPGSFGRQVLIYPPIQEPGCADQHTAFYGCRLTDEPAFYLHGRVIDVEWWQPLPEPPREERSLFPESGPIPKRLWSLWWNTAVARDYGYEDRVPVTLVRLSKSRKRAYIRVETPEGYVRHTFVPVDKLELRKERPAKTTKGESA